MAIPLCWFSLERLLSAMMIIQIVFQFIPQIFALFAIRKYRKEIKRPYGMWFYPVPAIIALIGWIYVASTPEQTPDTWAPLVILLVLGLGAYFLRARAVKSWPLRASRRQFVSRICATSPARDSHSFRLSFGGQQESRTMSCVFSTAGVGMLDSSFDMIDQDSRGNHSDFSRGLTHHGEPWAAAASPNKNRRTRAG